LLPKPSTARALLIGFPRSRRRRLRGRDHRRRHHSGRHGDDGQAGIHAAEAFVHAGYPLDVEALLIVELDGPEARSTISWSGSRRSPGLRRDHLPVSNSRRSGCCSGPGARRRFRPSAASRRLLLHGRHHPARQALPEVLARIRELSKKYGLRVANVFHAGDGNLHPLILYDANKPGELDKAEAFGADILRLCVEVGGVLTGEHGVGVEKRDLMPVMFTEIDLDQQQRLKCAFDPEGLLNPGKVFPSCTAAPNGWFQVRTLSCPDRTASAVGKAAQRLGRGDTGVDRELRRRHVSGRLYGTVQFSEAVYVLHAFKKKSKRGSKTPQTDVDLIKRRLKTATGDHTQRFGKESKR
jgi:FAD/FMN-containing dehydrogenase